jgi:hypothetical protein
MEMFKSCWTGMCLMISILMKLTIFLSGLTKTLTNFMYLKVVVNCKPSPPRFEDIEIVGETEQEKTTDDDSDEEDDDDSDDDDSDDEDVKEKCVVLMKSLSERQKKKLGEKLRRDVNNLLQREDLIFPEIVKRLNGLFEKHLGMTKK